VVAHTLNIDLELVSVKPSNNLTSPNGIVSGGSIASEACAYVSIEMCNTLVRILYLLLSQRKLFSSVEILSICGIFFYSADSVLTLAELSSSWYSLHQTSMVYLLVRL